MLLPFSYHNDRAASCMNQCMEPTQSSSQATRQKSVLKIAVVTSSLGVALARTEMVSCWRPNPRKKVELVLPQNSGSTANVRRILICESNELCADSCVCCLKCILLGLLKGVTLDLVHFSLLMNAIFSFLSFSEIRSSNGIPFSTQNRMQITTLLPSISYVFYLKQRYL